MKDIVFTADRQRELKKELLTMKWDSPEDATRVRVLLDKYTGMFDYGYDKPKLALEIFDFAELGRLRDEKTKRLEMQEAIDNLRDYAMSLDADIRGTLYYKILELADKYGTHSAGDYFKEAEE